MPVFTLGNKKSVDIVVVSESGDVVTIDVKGLAGTTSWPVDNVKKVAKDHFLVFVSFLGKIEDHTVTPEVYVVPSKGSPRLFITHPTEAGCLAVVPYEEERNRIQGCMGFGKMKGLAKHEVHLIAIDRVSLAVVKR